MHLSIKNLLFRLTLGIFTTLITRPVLADGEDKSASASSSNQRVSDAIIYTIPPSSVQSSPTNNSTVYTNTNPGSPTQPTSNLPMYSAPPSNNIVNPLQVNQQFANWGGSSSLIPPSCATGCMFAVTRFSTLPYSSSQSWEAMIGATIPLGPTDNGMTELNRINGDMQKFRIENETKVALSRELAEAIKNGDMTKAKLLAMTLSPMLGYKTYQSLLRELFGFQVQ